MNVIKAVGRSVGALCLGSLAALVGFGLLLGLAWLPHFGDSAGYRLVMLLAVTAVSILTGGYVSGSLAGHNKVHYGLVFGLLIGLVAFGYVLGPHWLLLVAVPVCGLLGAGGGWLAERRGFHVVSM